jgi:4-hydroxybenzoate polyprenyltransferase
MTHISIFFELTRLKKPIGYMLLFWPCAWGLTIAYDFQNGFENYILYIFLFFSGAVLMRSAGCIVNDIIDKNYDQKVERTKNRPLASNKISVRSALVIALILCLLALLVLINFNNLTIILALCSMPFAFTYPLMKRFTYWPQLFLGLTFNYGLLLGWVSIKESISLAPLIFYFGAIFWTLGYDTIYGYQDIKDDEIIGVKSTSIKFKNSPKTFIGSSYFLFFVCLILIGYFMKFNNLYYLFLLIPFFHLFLYQIKNWEVNNSNSCHKKFKSNNTLGLIVFLIILIEKNNFFI